VRVRGLVALTQQNRRALAGFAHQLRHNLPPADKREAVAIDALGRVQRVPELEQLVVGGGDL
jgi:hypothetical protein